MTSDAKKIFQTLKESNTDYSSIISFWKDKDYSITEKEILGLIKLLIEDDVFWWLELISEVLLPQISDEGQFLELIDLLIPQIRNDLAQGPFVKTLISIGQRNLDFAKALYFKMINEKEEYITAYAGLVLGGIGKADKGYLLKYLFEELEQDPSHVKVAKTKALRIAYEETETLSESGDVFKFIDIVSNPEEDVSVKLEAVFINLEFSKFDANHCFNNLVTLLKEKSELVIRVNLADLLSFKGIGNIDREFQLLELCYPDFNEVVLDKVFQYLAKNGDKKPQETFRIIRDLVGRGLYFHGTYLDYAINEIGKKDYATFLPLFEKWLLEEGDIRVWSFLLPKLIRELSKVNEEELIKNLSKWVTESKRLKLASLKIIERMLGLNCRCTEETIDSCFKILHSQALDSDKYVRAATSGAIRVAFGNRPRFAKDEKLMCIIKDWISDKEPQVRIAMLDAVAFLALDRIEEESILLFKEGSVIRKIDTRVVEPKLGKFAYGILEDLTQDDEKSIRDLAKKILLRVNNYLKQKEDTFNKNKGENVKG